MAALLKPLKSLLEVVAQCNSFLAASSSRARCRPFLIDGVAVGFIRYSPGRAGVDTAPRGTQH